MASTNINKIVQSNLNIKPWMLSKNTSHIVNSCIQKIYKQIPASFNKGTRIQNTKAATLRPENKGPLRMFKSQELEKPLATITPKATPVKKFNIKLKQQDSYLMNSLKTRHKDNQQMAAKFGAANVMPNKRLLKSPNYKIYKSRRFGSSASSSRSSLFRRHDERRHQRQTCAAQINYLIRSFHTSQFEPTYARYLMPARNQYVEANLGSIPDAIKFSTNIQNDLMKIDEITRNKFASNGDKKSSLKSEDRNRLDLWNHPPSISKFRINNPKDSATKNVISVIERGMKRAKLSPEQRDYARIHVLHSVQLKHPKPQNELFTAQHDRNRTELHEKHRRNRMKKLGLIESSTALETKTSDSQQQPHVIESTQQQHISVMKKISKPLPNLCNQIKLPKITPNISKNQQNQTNNTSENLKKENAAPVRFPSAIPVKIKTVANTCPTSQDLNSPNAPVLPKTYSTISPIAAARAQMLNRKSYKTYRYNQADFFSTKKY